MKPLLDGPIWRKTGGAKGWSIRPGGGSLDKMSARVGAGAGVEREDEGADMIVRQENQSFFFLTDATARTCVDAPARGDFGGGDGVMLGGDAWGLTTGTGALDARGRALYQSPT